MLQYEFLLQLNPSNFRKNSYHQRFTNIYERIKVKFIAGFSGPKNIKYCSIFCC